VSDGDATDFEAVDFFIDESLVADPYPYFEYLRGQCPVQRERHHGVMAVTGYDEAIAVLNDATSFSACNAPTGPFPGFPVPLEGDDVSALIAQYRDQLPMSTVLATMDPPQHTEARALLLRLLTPKRLKENEEFMWRLADRLLDELLARGGRCEFISEFAGAYTLLVIADLLGVPEADHPKLLAMRSGKPGALGGGGLTTNPLQYLNEAFVSYVEDRRREPRDDVLTKLATATYPDGSTPEVIDVVRVATFLFVAGQETTVRLLGTALQLIGEDPELQQLLRDQRDRIPNFIEETLRIESPIKSHFRLTRVSTNIAGVDVPAGTTVMLLDGAANRDPRHFENPDELDIDRPNARQHLAFGHGIHTCAGAPLARAEARVALERILERMTGIKISETEHGPAGARRYEYVPSYLFRGLTKLHLEFTPVDPPRA